MKQKFGGYDFNFSSTPNILWLHAVSVGEVQIAARIIEKVKDFEFVLTVSTPQAYEFANKLLKDKCKKITYFPYDFPFSVKSAIKAINPRALLIIETEIWVEIARQLKEKNIPILIVNGRISDKTFKNYYAFRGFFKHVFKYYHSILTQNPEYARRFIDIGADPHQVHIMGNIKFDIEKGENDFDLKSGANPVIVAGSTHKGEEALIVQTFNNLRKKHQNLKLLIAPRHLERVDHIQKKYSMGLRTKSDFLVRDSIILDTTGELKNAYNIATIAVVCGSFDSTGGHNPLEACIWGVPVISGPNVRNFKSIYNLLCEHKCATIVKNQAELEAKLEELLTDYKKLNIMQKNCVQIFTQNKGATDYLVKFLKGATSNEN